MSIGHTYILPLGPKQLQEAVNVASSVFNRHTDESSDPFIGYVQNMFREITAACQKMRPTGPDGKHGDRHTSQCGCFENPLGRYVCLACDGSGFNPLSRGKQHDPTLCLKCQGRGWTER